jgi:hypothetical protein
MSPPVAELTALVEARLVGLVRGQITHPSSPSNPALIASPGAVVKAHRSGATSIEQVELLEGSTYQLHVQNAGQIQTGDLVFADSQIDADPSEWLYVSAVASDKSWVEVQYAGARLMIFVGTRLTPSGSPPQMFLQAIGSGPVANVATDIQGRFQFFMDAQACDLVVHHATSTGWGPEVLPRPERGPQTLVDGWVNAADHPNLQAALSALPLSGGTVFVPAGRWPQSEALLFPTDRPVRLMGAGKNATVLHWASDPTGSASSQSDGLIRVRGDNQSIEDLGVVGPGPAPRVGPGRGIVVGRRVGERSTTQPMRDFKLRNCDISQTQGWVVYVYGNDVTSDPWSDPSSDLSVTIIGELFGSSLAYNHADGVVRIGQGTVLWTLDRLNIGATIGNQVLAIKSSALSCEDCAFDAPLDDVSELVVLQSCGSVSLRDCDFENPSSTLASKYFVAVRGGNAKGIQLQNCSFFRAPASSVPETSRAALPARVLIAEAGNPVLGLTLFGLTAYLAIGPGLHSTSVDDVLVQNVSSEVYCAGCIRSDDSAYSALRVNSAALRTTIAGPQRLRVPRLSQAEREALLPGNSANASDVVEGDVVYDHTLGQLFVFSKLNGALGWHAVVVS